MTRKSIWLIWICIFSFFCLSTGSVTAQWKNKLNNALKKASDKVVEGSKTLVKDELDDADKRADSTKFIYAISLSDNSATFETKSLLQKNNQMLTGIVMGPDKEDDPDKEAQQWIDLGENFYGAQKFKSAEVAFYAAKLIYETEEDTDNINYYTTLSNLGLLYHQMGRFDKSEEFTNYALAGRKDQLGPNSLPYSVSLNNQAVLKKDIGNYNESENLLDEALQANNQSGKDSGSGKAIILNNKGSLYQTLGRLDDAEQLLRESLEVAGEEFKESSGRYQKLMINLAVLLQEMKKYEESEEILQKAIRLKEKRLGKNHPDYAHMLMHLASLYIEMNKLTKVEELLIEAMGIYEKKFGAESLPYATASSNLGKLYLFQNDFDKAASFLKKTSEIRKSKLGENNPLYVDSNEDLAILYWRSGNTSEAYEKFKFVLDKSIEFINAYFSPMSEAEKTRYWDKLMPKFQRFYAFTADQGKDIPDIYLSAYNYRLATKALLLNATNKIKQKILKSGDRKLIEDYKTWLDQKSMIARYYEYSEEELNDQKINLDSLINKANDMERSLSERSDIFSSGYSHADITYINVSKVLDSDEAVIEIIQFNEFTNRTTENILYLLLIGRKGDEIPESVVLENGSQLDGRYYSFYKNAIRRKMEDRESYDQYWAELDKRIVGINHIYLSLDGIFNQINVNTILKPAGNYVIDDLDVTVVGNTREVIQIKSEEIIGIKSALLVGAPLYGNDDLLAPLPGTENEVQTINSILKSNKINPDILLGGNASETAVKNTSNPTVLHIATHGFFQKDVDPSKKEKVFGIEPVNAMENPLLRSGLFLTGAGHTLSDQNLGDLSGEDNGILMAFEAMNLSLDQTDIVVLSACETGLGDLKAGEGVYGLQRAFLVAGSKAIIMSLWKVNDQATQFLMTNFYQEWMITGDMVSSFKTAQLKLRKDYSDPYFWGAFILVRK
ncbi:CHAT domain-containing protein [Bacteroidota bacterium]